ncbi:peptidyl-prolyl cis-trans isomerase FKBP43-like isoform X2 [Benincasa hispida]|uniref:peptidyl-prolyl cis-trans isomerase FKBP43-like isoform X2 n=1 Tax=Benincasa hispida TaxID=102211 RepID=UPI0019011BD0|nr:peptidyl-prolyl cis-trans isomerase FKBP43-like isoform X2 [Benincasa hispida]
MAFWGTEVKPGKPFTQKFDDFKGRLHVSLATLGFGTATKKSVLQCNVGNKSPVYLCSLFPEKTECLQLNLEYEEADEVIFSVIGPRSIHLSGYFLGSCRHNNINDDNTESYGEDIANTETQSSEYGDEDNYEDSFINDEDPEVFSPSPISNEEDETFGKNKIRNKTCNGRRLRKSYQLSESDDEENSRSKNILKSGIPFSELESLDEENRPISSLCNNRTKGENAMAVEEKEAREHKVLHETSDLKIEFDGDFVTGVNGNTDGVFDDCQLNGELDFPIKSSEVSTKVGSKRKRKRKGEVSKRKSVEADGNSCSCATSGVEIQQDELKMDNTVNCVCEEKQETVPGAELLDNLSFPSADVGHEDSERPKKKKNKGSERGKIIENDGPCDHKPDKMDQDVQPTSDQTENHPMTKKVAKKKRTKAIENWDSLKSDISLSSSGAEKPTTETEDKESNGVSKSSQARTLPSGLVIEELEAGKPNGKVATLKRKISVLYVGKLKESGEIVDSTEDKLPYKFRLGTGQVIEGWNAGLDGMRVGEKRRLTVPPSMGYGNEGDGGNIPPDSWLVYDVELVKVH